MSIATRFVSSTARPRLDLKGCVFYAPLWRPDLGGSTFTTIGDNGIPTHLCTVTGATHGIQGRTFDGVDDQILIDDAANDYLNLTTALTYEVWVNPTDGGDDYGRFLSKTNADPYGTRTTLLGKELADETNVRWETAGTSPAEVLNSGADKMTVGAWNHVVGTYISGTKVIYVNGVSAASSTDTGSITSTAGGVLCIGALFTTNQNFSGIIGEVAIYNRALSAQEIMQNYQVTKWRYQ